MPSGPPPAEEFLDPPTEPGDLGRLGHYRILKQIGEGGMGMVFHALDTELGREVAVKVMRRDYCNSPDAAARFEREAKATAQIEHDHVIKLNRFGRIGSVLYLEMPLLRGESLHARLQREVRLPVADVLKIGREMAEGLAAAHAKGLIHRDVKPGNVFLSEENGGWRVRLLDLGLVRADTTEADAHRTRTGMITGTPAYMSPEQANSQPLDARSDLFSLGVVLYHALAGKNPFADHSLITTLLKITELVPNPIAEVRPDVPLWLSRLIERLMAKKPQDRPSSAREVADTLSEGGTVPIPPLPGRRSRRRLLLAGVLGASVILLTGATGYWLRNRPSGETLSKAPLHLQLSLTAMKKGQSQMKSLDDPNVLPLQAGDALRIEARTARPTYFYVLNLTADGKVSLMYPWRDDEKWDSINEEKPRDSFCVPEPGKGDAAKLEAGPSGIESVVVLARETPLTDAEREQLRQLLRSWPVDQGKFDPLRAAVSIGEDEFRFGDARDQNERGPIKAGDAVESSDPVLRLRRLLQGDVRPLGVASRGVCYTFKSE
jgi:serine/threonine protein kinase